MSRTCRTRLASSSQSQSLSFLSQFSSCSLVKWIERTVAWFFMVFPCDRMVSSSIRISAISYNFYHFLVSALLWDALILTETSLLPCWIRLGKLSPCHLAIVILTKMCPEEHGDAWSVEDYTVSRSMNTSIWFTHPDAGICWWHSWTKPTRSFSQTCKDMRVGI
jgi:hypothetical protein